MLIAFPFYLIALWLSNPPKVSISKNQYLWAIAMGLLGYYASSLFDFVGLQYISAGIERIILFIYPTLSVIINRIIYKVKISRIQFIAIGVTYLGIGIAYWGEFQQMPETQNFVYGSLMVLMCGITYAFYLVGTGKLVPVMGASRYTSVAMLAASFGIFVHYLVNATYQQTSLIPELPIPILGFIVALGLIATVIPSFLLNWGMKQVGSNNLAIITSIGPVATLFQTNFILGEPFTWYQFIGTALVIIGVLLIKNLG